MLQTILGSGGIIGIEIAKALKTYDTDIRLVSRNPTKVNPDDELYKADLLDAAQVNDAVMGSSIVYFTAGLPYNTKIWQTQWPVLMKNVIQACLNNIAKLVFFDNIYMYNPNLTDGMTEQTQIGPKSKKGAVRNQISQMVLDAIANESLIALIARSADFYGPGIKEKSVITEMVFKPLSEGKKANWMGSAHQIHSFTYTPDAGKATALLGNTPSAYNQIWHLPTSKEKLTGRQWIALIAQELKAKPKFQVAPKTLVRIMGLFVPVMKEMVEMMYQFDQPYFFDSSKFENHFDLKPTEYTDGIKAIVKSDYS